MIESKQEFNELLERLRTLKKENRLGRHMESKLEAFEEVQELINLSIYGVVFNEATAINESILEEPQPLYKEYYIDDKSEVELKCVWCETNERYQHMGICKKCFDKYPM